MIEPGRIDEEINHSRINKFKSIINDTTTLVNVPNMPYLACSSLIPTQSRTLIRLIMKTNFLFALIELKQFLILRNFRACGKNTENWK